MSFFFFGESSDDRRTKKPKKQRSKLFLSHPVLDAKQEMTTSTPLVFPSLVAGSKATLLRDSASATLPNRTSAPSNSFLVASASALPPTPDFSLEKATTSNPLARSSFTTNLPMYPVGPTTRTRTSCGLRERYAEVDGSKEGGEAEATATVGSEAVAASVVARRMEVLCVLLLPLLLLLQELSAPRRCDIV